METLLPKGTCPAINQNPLRTVTKSLATILLLHKRCNCKRSPSKREEKVSVPCKATSWTCADKVLCPPCFQTRDWGGGGGGWEGNFGASACNPDLCCQPFRQSGCASLTKLHQSGGSASTADCRFRLERGIHFPFPPCHQPPFLPFPGPVAKIYIYAS